MFVRIFAAKLWKKLKKSTFFAQKREKSRFFLFFSKKNPIFAKKRLNKADFWGLFFCVFLLKSRNFSAKALKFRDFNKKTQKNGPKNRPYSSVFCKNRVFFGKKRFFASKKAYRRRCRRYAEKR